MKSHITQLWQKVRYYLDDQRPGYDAYVAQCDWIEITPHIRYATGLIVRENHKVSSAEYQKGFFDIGSDEMMYWRPDDIPLFGGDQIYVLRDGYYVRLAGLYLKSLRPSGN